MLEQGPGVLKGAAELLGHARRVAKQSQEGNNQVLCLRQFRSSSARGPSASLRSALTFVSRTANMQTQRLTGPFTVTVNPCDSEPMAQELGIAGPLKALGVRNTCDITLELSVDL